MVTVKLMGVEAALQKLQAVNRSVGRRIIRKCVRASVQVAAKRGKSDVPKGLHGLLKKSLGWKLLKQRAGIFKAAGLVGPRTKVFLRVINGKRIDPGKYGHLVEGGTKPHAILPKTKTRLAFRSGGRLRVVKSVRHPGARRTGFLGRIQVVNTHGMSRAFRDTCTRELAIQAAKAKPSEVDDG